MKLKLILIVLLCTLGKVAISATDIGFGTVKGIKVYELGSDKSIRVHFNDDVTFENTQCGKIATVTYSAHDKEFVDRFLSIALAAYISNKKVRIASNTSDCEASFIAIQESRF